MRQLLYIVGIALLAGAIFASCKNAEDTTKTATPTFEGVWHYELVTQSVQGAASDTTVFDYVGNPQEQQLYEVYLADSTMHFYAIQNDTLLNKLEFRYTFRNDSLCMLHPDKPLQSVHVVSHADSVIHIDYVRTLRDTTFYMTSTTRRCQMPIWKYEK